MYEIRHQQTNDEDLALTFTIEDDEGTRPVGDFTFDLVIGWERDCASPLVTVSSGNAWLTTDAETDEVTILIPAATVSGWCPRTYFIGLRCTETATGDVKQLATGTLVLQEGGY